MTTLLLAEEPLPNPKQAPDVPFYLNPLFMMAVMVLFFFVVMWPAQRRQKREQQAMLAALKPGTKIVTTGGLIGTIVKSKDGEEDIVIKSEDTKFRILRSAVARVIGTDDSAEAK